jgi:anthranilate phosphoribosyltransferase
MHPDLVAVVDPVLAHRSFPEGALRAAVSTLMQGQCSDAEIASLLTVLAMRGETDQDLAEAASVMREKATCVPVTRTGLLDTCGTGGDRLHTFNISTAAALVAAACGVPVAKHGNRQASSSTGSADVLEALGVNLQISAEDAARCIDEIGIGFCFARALHPAMKHVAEVRKTLPFRTIFNLLGPLSNPAKAEFQLIGASRNATAEKLAGAMARLGTVRTLVVCGADQLDEVSLWGTTRVLEVTGSKTTVSEWTATDLGLPACEPGDLTARSPQESADIIREVFEGRPGAKRDIVVANAAAALLTASKVDSLKAGVAAAQHALDSRAAADKLEELIHWTNKRAS